MTPTRQPQRSLFFKQHVLPVLFVFLLPGFSAWFFAYAERSTDRQVTEGIVASIASDPGVPPADKPRLADFYQRVPPSRILASHDPRLVRVQGMFSSLAFDYATFRWMQRLAWVCLGTIALTFLIVGVSVWYSFRSHAAQYRALRVGWPVLQFSAAVQVPGLAVLAVALSYWVTVFFFHSYVPKLILIIAFLALAGVVSLWRAIFAKVDDRCQVNGEILAEADAPRLWQHVRALADRLRTAPPDQIIVGIEPSFFVTEHPIILGGQTYHGRTLFLSLPMLKVCTTDETDAVLGHELAHFSGEDTLWARKISPLTGRFELYLRNLFSGLSALVAHFMLCFWKLYGLSIRRLSRAREFRADRVGADLVSPDAAKRALVKITGYCDYRAATESSIVQQRRVDPTLDLSGQLETGFPAFLSGFTRSDEAVNERVPHPFDSHPTLHNRLAELGFDAREALRDAAIQQPVAESWYAAIHTAPTLESRLWTDRQAKIQTFHAEQLAWRLLPADEEEEALVLRHFPPATFRDKKGREAKLAYDRFQLADWTEPIFFRDITGLKVVNAWRKKLLVLLHRTPDRPKPVKTKCYPGLYQGERGDLLTAFGLYYSRHKTAEAAHREAQLTA